ncbi:MAG: hypothetical protein IGQ88_06470 [Gloeomargaritaceae cyanobacterium C42_A2020_066]|nr:hypothetical protein [Gloeomargaritaceae cyanobacterium C42_A2020_066]
MNMNRYSNAIAFALIIGLSAGSLPALAQATPAGPPPEMVKARGPLRGIDLSPEQQARLRQIHQETRTQISGVLTPEQRQQTESRSQRWDSSAPREGMLWPRMGMRNLNLSEAQRDQIKTIMERSRSQVQNLLTPEQRQQYEANIQSMRQRWENRKSQPPMPQ